jgi:hypothetical protein
MTTETITNVFDDNRESEPKSRGEWAAEITKVHTKTAEAILCLGLTLTAAKKALPHGEWLEIFERREVPFTATVAQRLMKIAADHRLANAAQMQLLPTKWATMYELTKLPDQKLEAAIADGTINPKMKHKDAAALVEAPKRKSPPDEKLSDEEMDEQDAIEHDSDPRNHYKAYLLRVGQAKAFAGLSYSGKVTKEIINLARGVAKAWTELADKFEEQYQSSSQRARIH